MDRGEKPHPRGLVGRTPWSRSRHNDISILRSASRPTGASAADQGVRPTNPGGPVFHGISVAVGMPVARPPPHRSVRALLTHTVLTSDVLTQSVPPDTDAGSRLPVSGVRVSPEIGPSSSGFVDSAVEVATTTC